MKPLRLSLQAFGPYAGEAKIDFRQLAKGGLFLIHGETGAGKTSILDGICFSLFGKSSGAERSASGMRSDLAAPDLPTEARFEFALGTKLYRVIRRPAQELTRLRGTGTRIVEAQADLFEWEGALATESWTDLDLDAPSWKLLTSGEKKTSARLVELLGMTDEQFRQVIVLPQGQFRRFLAAGSEDREKILETLFRTSRYRAITKLLSERATQIANRINENRQKLSGLFVSLDVQNPEQLDTRFTEISTRSKELETLAPEIERRHVEATSLLNLARDAARLDMELDASQRREAELEARRPAIAELVARLEAERRARPILSADETLARLHLERRQLGAELSREQLQFERTKDAAETARTKFAEVRSREAQNKEDETARNTLKEQYRRASELKELARLATAAIESQARAELAATASESAVAEARERSSGLKERILALTVSAGRLETVKAERDLLARELKALDEALALGIELEGTDGLQARLRSLEDAVIEAESAALQARETLMKHRLAYHLGQAAALARQLEPDRPCPVCGSTSHPQPAQAIGAVPSQSELDQLEAKLTVADGRVSERKLGLERAKADLQAKQEALKQRFDGSIDDARKRRGEVAAFIAEKVQQESAAAKAKAELEGAKADVARIEAATQALELVWREKQAERDLARRNADTTRARVTQLEGLVPEDRRDLERIVADGQALKERIDAFARDLREASQVQESAVRDLAASEARLGSLRKRDETSLEMVTKTQADLDALVASSSFGTVENVRQARLTTDEIGRLEKARSDFENEKAVVHDRLTSLREKRAQLPAALPALEEAERSFTEAESAHRHLVGERASIAVTLKGLDEARRRLQEMNDSTAELEKRYEVLGRLAGVASGQPPHNLTRVNFSRFVLANQLDEVLEQASRRLHLMSGERFVLRRARGVDDKRRNAGLDLEVEDGFTGSTRPTSSLSGGEGFLASLSLALGLADVVQSHLGGVRLDAVFVDEGFGSLDGETLDQAMKVLAELANSQAALDGNSRLIGIISHVPELRQQVTHRLLVRKTPDGSRVGWET